MLSRTLSRLLLVCVVASPAGWAGWVDVPWVAQQRNGCGAAATAMVMQYWHGKGFGVAGAASEAGTIYDALYSSQANGIAGSRIGEYLRQKGFRSFVFAGGWYDLAWHIERGRPLIVCVRNAAGGLHYLVVAGLDEARQTVLVNDSARRELNRLDRASFERDWAAGGNWTLLALPAAL